MARQADWIRTLADNTILALSSRGSLAHRDEEAKVTKRKSVGRLADDGSWFVARNRILRWWSDNWCLWCDNCWWRDNWWADWLADDILMIFDWGLDRSDGILNGGRQLDGIVWRRENSSWGWGND